MKERIGISIVLLLCLFGLVPSFFAKGGFLDFLELFWDNVFFTLMYLLAAWVGIAIPFILPKMGRVWCVISQMFGAWFFAAFMYEVFNFRIPDVVLNSSEDRSLFTKFLIAFIVGLSFIIIRETWQKTDSK